MYAIEIINLEFSYESSNGQSTFVLKIPELRITKGDFVSLLGPNGCGKSTLLRLIANLTETKSGSILINGKDILDIERKELAKKIAYVPQKNFSIFPFSVYEIVMMGRSPYLNLMGFENAVDKQIVAEAMNLMQVDNLMHKGINELSGGEAQRVFIARALAQKAEIILLDEPNAHLDLEHQIMIFDLLKKLNQQEKITVLTVSHDLNLVGIYSQKVALMKDGIIVMEGEKSKILNETNIKNIFKIDSAIFPSEDKKSMNILISPNSAINSAEMN
ncbi:MAG: ABC transporter ATP-binding protein [Melioribacteraceae bacterium]